jgi:hypothetical protein
MIRVINSGDNEVSVRWQVAKAYVGEPGRVARCAEEQLPPAIETRSFVRNLAKDVRDGAQRRALEKDQQRWMLPFFKTVTIDDKQRRLGKDRGDVNTRFLVQ